MIRSNSFAFAFCFSIVIFMMLAAWFAHFGLSTLSQVVGFIGTFLLSIEVIGKRRTEALDNFLTSNAENLDKHLTALVTSFLLIKSKSRLIDPEFYGTTGDWDILVWYLFSLADLIAWSWFVTSGAKILFGRSALEVILGYIWQIIAIFGLYFFDLTVFRFLPTKVQRALWYPWLVLWVIIALFMAWGTILWLFFSIITFLVFKGLICILRFKRRFELGNVFVIIGFLMTLFSFTIFVAQNSKTP